MYTCGSSLAVALSGRSLALAPFKGRIACAERPCELASSRLQLAKVRKYSLSAGQLATLEVPGAVAMRRSAMRTPDAFHRRPSSTSQRSASQGAQALDLPPDSVALGEPKPRTHSDHFGNPSQTLGCSHLLLYRGSYSSNLSARAPN